jgi:hypothetical protein
MGEAGGASTRAASSLLEATRGAASRMVEANAAKSRAAPRQLLQAARSIARRMAEANGARRRVCGISTHLGDRFLLLLRRRTPPPLRAMRRHRDQCAASPACPHRHRPPPPSSLLRVSNDLSRRTALPRDTGDSHYWREPTTRASTACCCPQAARRDEDVSRTQVVEDTGEALVQRWRRR